MTLADQKSQLFPLLQKALELELSIIPPYLTALLSIAPRANRVAANLIRGVMMEEMLHLVLVGNLAASVGCKLSLGPENMPSYPLRLEFKGQAFKDRDFYVDLAPFSPESIATFMQIELPASLLPQPKALAAFSELEIPNITIGTFYQAISGLLEKMCAEFPESEVFSGDPTQQVTIDYYWSSGGKPVVITSLASAQEALNVIITQGEGGGSSIFDDDKHYFDQPGEVAHYFRFKEIALGRHYRPGDKPSDPPSGEPFEVDYAAVLPIKRNAKSSDYEAGSRLAILNDLFNRQYSVLLNQIAQAFSGTPSVLYDAIVNGMHGMTPTALEMMSLRINDAEETRGAPSFEWSRPLSPV